MKSKSRKKTASKRMIARAPRLSRRSSAFVFVACLGVWLPRSYGATLVDLDATQLPLGLLNTWTNTGTLPGNFTVPTGATVPSVVATNGVKGVSFLATGGGAGGTQYLGPIAPAAVTGSNPRTIEAWVYDPSPQAEETVFAWGRRGGAPDGSNFSFGHGTDPGFGANALWGGPDIGGGYTTGPCPRLQSLLRPPRRCGYRSTPSACCGAGTSSSSAWSPARASCCRTTRSLRAARCRESRGRG